MNAKAFLDTNVLIYLFSETEPDKRNDARSALKKSNCVTSTQALNEACNVWLKKYGWSGDTVRKHLDNIASRTAY
ncbi:MAG: PIN domain-containing protein [Clostridiales bacterium]|jgi:predicted nucleic acid-binding protein|nr:PIN domain-containing protein [Clostridiales bacterium]